MEKRTLLAVVLSIVVISGFYIIQGMFFPPQAPLPAEAGTVQAPVEQSSGGVTIADSPAALSGDEASLGDRPLEDAVPVITGPASEQRVTIDTGLIQVVLTNAGGDMVSYKLKEHKDRDDFVEMVLAPNPEASGARESHAFTLAFGSLNTEPVRSFFYVNRPSEYIVEFYRDFALSADGAGGSLRSTGSPGQFRLTKRYEFRPGEYMFELTVSLDIRGQAPALNFSGAAYTLGFGPQFGPRFEKLDQR
jgi:YidC/Oxa1 family membrane protein insertase